MAYERSAALRAAIELDLFRAVGEGPGDVPSLARQCSASERGIRILCDYLTIMGFLEKREDSYRHTATSAAFLDPRSPACVASLEAMYRDAEFDQVSAHQVPTGPHTVVMAVSR